MSINLPNTAEAKPPIPNAKPQKNPEIIPIFWGNNSCEQTKIEAKADEMMKPISTMSIAVVVASA